MRPDVAGESEPLRTQVGAEPRAIVQTADSTPPAKAGGKTLCHSAKPQPLRQCRARKKPPRLNDIACNITKSSDFGLIFATVCAATAFVSGMKTRRRKPCARARAQRLRFVFRLFEKWPCIRIRASKAFQRFL